MELSGNEETQQLPVTDHDYSVTATDINNPDIIDLIKRNCSNNKVLIKEDVNVKPLDFGENIYS